ncbi:glycosyltransferase family 4 protein [Citrobacter braakii]|uniref:glycosyltransferase family 4 protein n=1 Tax=Citrobacter braakii TaxID=57706 RepID=UPI0005439C5F|nr:glycosyltransferase family 4 protein [Citrobacter braakii]KHE05245.1 glycosyl transferase family 1 [Citrobacter braakii]MBJ8848335.1 glycosyltransferase [Citrobacter braakii]
MTDETQRKKILVLTPRFPYPVIGGDRLRIYKLCKALSENYDLTLLSLCEHSSEVNAAITDNVFSDIHRVFLPKYLSYYNVLKALPTKVPLQVAYYRSEQFQKKFNELVTTHDAVFCHLIRVADYAKDADIVKFIDMTDAISLNYSRVKKHSNKKNIRALIYSIEQSRLEKYEREIAHSFDLATFISPVDRNFLYPTNNDNIKVVNNGVDTGHLLFKERFIDVTKPIELVFIGNMFSMQNMDAAIFFAKEILPKIAEEFDVIFKVIGKISEANKKTLNSYANTIAIGIVGDINEASQSGHIGVCPVRLGAGVQNKVLEYMALGLPCISSSIGFEGIEASNGTEIIIADTVDEYKKAIRLMTSNNEYYANLAKNAREFVVSNFSWKSRLSTFMNAIEENVYAKK